MVTLQKIKASVCRGALHLLLSAVSDFIYPPRCAGCGQSCEERPFCPVCREGFGAACAARLQSGHGDFSHLSGPLFFDVVLSGWDFAPLIAHLIHQFKYQDKRSFAKIFGNGLTEVLSAQAEHWPEATLLPVPLHAVRKRERGYNQSALLARAVGSAMDWPVDESLLQRHRQTETQTHLDAEARQANVGGAFRLRDMSTIEGRAFLVVDDVITTGATLNACAALLKSAGAAWVGGLAVSRPDHRKASSVVSTPEASTSEVVQGAVERVYDT